MKKVDLIKINTNLEVIGLDPIYDLHVNVIMEDGSVLIFEDVEGYYEFIGDAELVNQIDNDYDIEKLIEKYSVNEITGDFQYFENKVKKVISINHNGSIMYYLPKVE